MTDILLLGLGRQMLPVPGLVWRRHMLQSGQEARTHALTFMSADHHRVREFVVLNLPCAGHPLAPQEIAARLGLPLERVTAILDDLERHLTFLYRNGAGEVAWAYPVTCEPTPHHLRFSSGETIYAA